MKPWEQTAKTIQTIIVIVGAASTLFMVASGAVQNIMAVPGIQKHIAETDVQVGSMNGKLNFVVTILAERSGRRYDPAKWEPRRENANAR